MDLQQMSLTSPAAAVKTPALKDADEVSEEG